MEDKCSDSNDDQCTDEARAVPVEDKATGNISTSTTTTSLYTEDEEEKPKNMSPGAVKLRSWLNQLLRITMTDGRVLIGMFFCTDRDANIILGACSEYLPEEADIDDAASKEVEEPRILGLVMVPGKHIVSISVNESEEASKSWNLLNQPLSSDTITQDNLM